MFLGKRKRKMTREEMDAIVERSKAEKPLELEKGDRLAMVMAAFIVFVPVVLAIVGALVGVWWFIFYVWGG